MSEIFHVHTRRCGHASDEAETDYIAKAIELGATGMIFTDHAPFPGDPFRNRMKMSELPEYLMCLSDLSVRYERLIRIQAGLEIEYLLKFTDYYKELKESPRLDLLVLGQHFSETETGYPYELRNRSEEHKYLAEGMMKGMETGFFEVVAHPDQIFRRLKEWNEEAERIAAEIKQCALENRVVIEYNLRNVIGRKKKRGFRPEFWEDLPEGTKVIYGVDAHSVAELEEGFLLQKEHYQSLGECYEERGLGQDMD